MALAGKRIGRAASVACRRLVGRQVLIPGRISRSAQITTVCKVHKVCVLPGDGIGPEIMEVATKALTMAGAKEGEDFEYKYCLIGGAAIDATGKPLPDETLATAKESDAVLLAAIGGYKWDTLPSAQRPERGLLAIRAGLNAFANLRPAIVPRQLADSSPLKRELVEGVDILIVRELVGGIYFGQPRGFGVNEKGERIGFNTDVYSEPEVERIARVAFEAARKRSKRLCSVEKSNVLEVSQLWKEVVIRVGKDYPDVELSHMYIDNAAMQLLRNPKYFDVIVTGNIFGDILSDEASMLAGSLGLLPSASISGSGPGIYEPVHGSAPDIAGKDVANPLAMVLSAAMMCRYDLSIPKVADRLEAAVNAVLDAGLRTGDIYKEGPDTRLVKCSEMGSELMKHL
ncbi:3-Isopropylmalate dehydrogenase [Volvox carteri f. nagariensis]|uniref:3-isopropylmalate dehydrogenase n=1 Tax=Volvox carteri f. nagariensis TaxID=3068 RepID=D8U8V9_VOLCA|nr:3-Isopropylmalate dehydrogenase [Volvox carteri f. nagariensis]EFJ43816.1 3-Isopropylmalate dehydrogenase [Volvox carteri f. nagariensis]|eukprot:XP_002955062.1 3-Isopropylmalate dehydrogenase [Volvox carteri f. nagariensis]